MVELLSKCGKMYNGNIKVFSFVIKCGRKLTIGGEVNVKKLVAVSVVSSQVIWGYINLI